MRGSSWIGWILGLLLAGQALAFQDSKQKQKRKTAHGKAPAAAKDKQRGKKSGLIFKKKESEDAARGTDGKDKPRGKRSIFRKAIGSVARGAGRLATNLGKGVGTVGRATGRGLARAGRKVGQATRKVVQPRKQRRGR